ncbi:MAG: YgiT-type zinc finger protein [Sulfuricellaceae bacterium]
MDSFTHLCLNCERADMQLQTQDITLSFDGLSLLLTQVRGWHCPVCGEIEFTDKDSAERYDATLETLHAEAQLRP